MNKKLLALCLVLSLSSNIQTTAHEIDYEVDFIEKKANKWKAGLCGGLLMPQLGPFVEYKPLDWLGVRTGLLVGLNFTLVPDKQQQSGAFFNYLAAPLVARFYPGAGRQFCFFAGIRGAYLTSLLGGILPEEPQNEKTEALDYNSGFMKDLVRDIRKHDKSLQKVLNLNSLARRTQLYVSTGIDYEFSGGFQLALDIEWRVTRLLKDYDTIIKGAPRILLGYNFAKCF